MSADELRNLPDQLRGESIVDAIATIIQAGHRDRKTSHEVAGEVVQMLKANAK